VLQAATNFNHCQLNCFPLLSLAAIEIKSSINVTIIISLLLLGSRINAPQASVCGHISNTKEEAHATPLQTGH
jgi:hypothetical protein